MPEAAALVCRLSLSVFCRGYTGENILHCLCSVSLAADIHGRVQVGGDAGRCRSLRSQVLTAERGRGVL